VRALALGCGLAVCMGATAMAQGVRPALSTLREVGPSIYRCWRPPAGSTGEEITVIFSFNRKGEVFGKPRVSHSTLTGSVDHQKDFVASVFGAIKDCTPLNFTDALGGSLAGRPFAMRFVNLPKRVGV
jgi:hypothetical protein